MKIWKEKGGRGPVTKEDCQIMCEIDGFFEEYHCVPRTITYPHEKTLCLERIPYDWVVSRKIKECAENCRYACFDSKYIAKSQVVEEMTKEEAKEKFNTSTVVILEFQFDVFESTLYREQPSYEEVELFSYIGGYLGMWLGWSVVAMLDFFEILLRIIKYPFTMKRKIKKYRRKMKESKENSPKTFRSYCLEFLKESSLTGIHAILKSKRCCGRLVKLSFIVVGVIGFFYQTYEFLQVYSQYSTVVSVTELDNIRKPALTICDTNLLRRNYICEKKPLLCRNDFKQDDICNLYRAYCVDTSDLYTKVPLNDKMIFEDEYFELNFTKEYGSVLHDKILQCEWFYTDVIDKSSNGVLNNSCSKPLFVRGLTRDGRPAACYTLESSIGNSQFSSILLSNARLSLTLNWSNAELNNAPKDFMFLDLPTPRVYYISVHNPEELSNPLLEGFEIKERTEYRIQISQVNNIRLPPPYASGCFDYIKAWRKNGGRGPVTKKNCENLCEIDGNFEEYLCVPRYISYPHEKAICSEILPNDFALNMKIQECKRKCRDACDDTKYSIARSEVLNEMTEEEAINKYKTPCIVTLEIQFDLLQSKMSKDKPKYEEIELFSYIGGYLGMWLGWSLLALIDFFEIVMRILKYPLTVKMKRRKKTIVEPIIFTI